MSSIIVSDLEYGPPGGDQLFFDVNFRVGPGEHAAIVGANGVGKSDDVADDAMNIGRITAKSSRRLRSLRP